MNLYLPLLFYRNVLKNTVQGRPSFGLGLLPFKIGKIESFLNLFETVACQIHFVINYKKTL